MSGTSRRKGLRISALWVDVASGAGAVAGGSSNDWPRPSLTLEPMQSKQKRAYDPSQLPTAKRLRANVANLWTTNRLTASEAQSLIDDAHDSGLSGFARLSSRGKSTAGGNVTRRLRTNFLKGSLWPKKYWAQIRCWNFKQNKEVKAWIALGLPHEYVAQIVRYGDLGRLSRAAEGFIFSLEIRIVFYCDQSWHVEGVA